MVFWSGYFPAVVQSLRIFNRMKKHSSRNLSNFGNSNIYIYIIDTFFKMFLLNEGYLDPSVSRKKSLLLNYSKFAMGDFSINNKFLQPRDRERERESDQASLSGWNFIFDSLVAAFSRPLPPPGLTRLSQSALACYWAVVYFGLIITSGANDSMGRDGNREQRQRQRQSGRGRFEIYIRGCAEAG